MAIPKYNEARHKVVKRNYEHKHDCDLCKYVCTYETVTYGIDITTKYTDVYVCPLSGTNEGTIVIRYSDVPDDYTSGTLPTLNTIPESIRDEVFRRIVWGDTPHLNWSAYKISPKHWRESQRFIAEQYPDL